MNQPDIGFSRRFREACLNNSDLSTRQIALGKALGVSGAMVSKYRAGEKLPSMATAIRIADKCGVCVEWLLTGRGTKTPTTLAGSERLTVDQIFDLIGAEGVSELFSRMQEDLAKSIASKNSE